MKFCKTHSIPLVAIIQLTLTLEQVFTHAHQCSHHFHVYSVVGDRHCVINSVRMELVEIRDVNACPLKL